MTRVALRTLAEKSTLKFGKFKDLTVRQVIQLQGIKGIKYLRWIYYSASNISFNEELLKELGIHEEIKIQKPGKLKEDQIADFLRKVEKVEISEQDKRMAIKTRNVLIKAKRMKNISNSKILKNKGRNQNRNHGRKF